VARVQGELSRRGVPLAGIERPFTLKLAELYRAINEATAALGPSPNEGGNGSGHGGGYGEAHRAANAERRMERIRAYISGRLAGLKANPDPRVRDLGTVMHLILCEEMASLNQLIKRAM
jgi:hypothetical protein